MSGRRRRAERNTQMNDATAASAIQSWFSGNVTRNKMEETRVNSNMEKGGGGAGAYQAESRLRRRSTVRLSKVFKDIQHEVFWALSFLLELLTEPKMSIC